MPPNTQNAAKGSPKGRQARNGSFRLSNLATSRSESHPMLPLPNDPPFRSVRFELLADAEPGLAVRALAPFARRNLIPDVVRMQRRGAAMLVEIRADAMPSEMLHLVEGNLRQIVGVQRLVVVLCAEQRKAG